MFLSFSPIENAFIKSTKYETGRGIRAGVYSGIYMTRYLLVHTHIHCLTLSSLALTCPHSFGMSACVHRSPVWPLYSLLSRVPSNRCFFSYLSMFSRVVPLLLCNLFFRGHVCRAPPCRAPCFHVRSCIIHFPLIFCLFVPQLCGRGHQIPGNGRMWKIKTTRTTTTLHAHLHLCASYSGCGAERVKMVIWLWYTASLHTLDNRFFYLRLRLLQ